MSRYLAEFHNVTLTILDTTDTEKLDRFVKALKYEIRVEVLKAGISTIDEAAKVSLRIDSTPYGARRAVKETRKSYPMSNIATRKTSSSFKIQ